MTECICCGATARRRRFDVPETVFGTGEMFRYEECGACGSLQLEHVPEDLGKFYPNDYFSFATRTTPAPKSRVRRFAALAVVGRRTPFQSLLVRSQSPSWADWFQNTEMRLDDPVLDVGSGSGGLLQNLARYGFTNLEGVDPFIPGDIDYPSGVRIRKRRLEDTTGSFQVILFNHSLEHSPAPRNQLKYARALLMPRGRLVIRVPMLGGSFRRYGPAFVGLEEAPRHVFVPSVEGLVSLASRAGFECLRVIHDGTAHHVLVSQRRAAAWPSVPARDGPKPTRLERVRARIRARSQNRANSGDTATFLFRATAQSKNQ